MSDFARKRIKDELKAFESIVGNIEKVSNEEAAVFAKAIDDSYGRLSLLDDALLVVHITRFDKAVGELDTEIKNAYTALETAYKRKQNCYLEAYRWMLDNL